MEVLTDLHKLPECDAATSEIVSLKSVAGHDSDNKYLRIILEHIAKIYPLFILICSNFYVRLLYAPFCSLSPFLGHQQAP